jgi:hypothetical protein
MDARNEEGREGGMRMRLKLRRTAPILPSTPPSHRQYDQGPPQEGRRASNHLRKAEAGFDRALLEGVLVSGELCLHDHTLPVRDHPAPLAGVDAPAAAVHLPEGEGGP